MYVLTYKKSVADDGFQQNSLKRTKRRKPLFSTLDINAAQKKRHSLSGAFFVFGAGNETRI
jgi:serine phosphatase RsbU (regulator of sigma subunit)